LTDVLLSDIFRSVLHLDPLFLTTFSDLLVNLSAGWFGAAFIVPLASKKTKIKWWVLLLNISFGMISLINAFLLKKIAGL